MAPLLLLQKECGPKCKSHNHVEEITSLIIKCSLVEFKAFSFLCHNWAQHSDTNGRTALHIAASSGKIEIMNWLLEDSRVELSIKDLESGYTALHRALLYGQLAVARLLIQHNSDLYAQDNEGMNPLDIAMFSRPPTVTYSLNEPNEVYTWGENYNNILGHASSHRRTHPEVMDSFRKLGITIKQVVFCKYHSVFLSHAGQVYTCGHGQGGRLGHGDQQTLLVPKLLESIKDETCLEISAATDHTLLRMKGGLLYTFGINSSHQLGQTPYVESSFQPKQVNVKPLKGRTITGVCVGRFHSVVCTSDSLFTVGLNAGQLGHLKGEKHISQLKLVSSLRHTDIGIARIACSDAATVCLTTKGDILVLHEYQCRKILSKWQEFEQILVIGGNLDHSTEMGILNEKGGTDLCVYMRNDGGQIFKWQSSSPTLKRCQFSLKRHLKVSDMVVTHVNIAMVTQSGEAFIAVPSGKKGSASDSIQKEIMRERDSSPLTIVQEMLLSDEIEEFNVRRLLGVHRAVCVAADRKGRNFAVIQALPNGCLTEIPSVSNSEINHNFKRLLSDADVCDSVHDALIQIEEKVWPVHRYIIAMRSDHCRSAVAKNASLKSDGKLLIPVSGVSPLEMEQIIKFMYTDTCDFLTIGQKIKPDRREQQHPKGVKNERKVKNDNKEEIDRTMSAFQVEQTRKDLQASKENNSNNNNNSNKTKMSQGSHQNPIKSLQEAARKLGVKGLSKRLDAVKCVDGMVVPNGKCLLKPRVKFERTKLPELHDITIATEDGKEIRCHQCVLICRLEYFYSMLARGWVESVNNSSLTLPVRSDVLEILIDFLYTDEALSLRDCVNEELVCNVLVVADQMLAWRLKEICEVALTNIITLKNVSELLEFATVYNADQLKLSCQQFVCLNITALLEARGLDVCSDETMQELTHYYRSVTPKVRYRVMTPPDRSPDQKYLDDLVAEYESHESVENQQYPHDLSIKGRQVKKRAKTRNKSTSEDAPTKSIVAITSSLVEQSPDNCIANNADAINLIQDKKLVAVLKDLNQEMEGEEKKMKALAAKHDKTRWRPLNTRAEGSCSIVPTQPEDVPVWTSNLKPLAWTSKAPNSNAVDHSESSHDVTDFKMSEGDDSCPSSPTSPCVLAPSPTSPSYLATSPTCLRDIIMEESQSEPTRKSSLSSRFSWKDAKKRQAREIQDRHKGQQLCGEVRQSGDAKLIPKAAVNPWAAVGNMVSSFRDLMLREEDVKQTSKTPNHQMTLKTGREGGTAAPASGHKVLPVPGSKPIACPSSSPRGENPWQRMAVVAAASPPTERVASALNFSAIVQDEMEKVETLEKVKQKPLWLIQLEEQAMLELLSYYNASDRANVTVTVERVSKVMATPLWHHERDHVGSL